MSGVATTNRKRSFLFSKRLTYFRFVYLIYQMNSWQMTKSPRILSYRGVDKFIKIQQAYYYSVRASIKMTDSLWHCDIPNARL